MGQKIVKRFFLFLPRTTCQFRKRENGSWSFLVGHLALLVWCLAHVVSLSDVKYVIASNQHFTDFALHFQVSFSRGVSIVVTPFFGFTQLEVHVVVLAVEESSVLQSPLELDHHALADQLLEKWLGVD